MHSKIQQTIKLMNKITGVLVGIFCFLIIFSMILQVFWRYILGSALAWPEELARFSFVWCTFFAAALGISENTHVKIDSLLQRLSLKSRLIVEGIVYVAMMIVLVFVGIYGIELFQALQDSQMVGLKIPLAYMYLPVPIGCVLMILNLLYLITDNVKAYFGSNSVSERGEINC